MQNPHTKGGKGACIPIDNTLQTIGADAVARGNRFEKQIQARLKLRPHYDPESSSFNPANAMSFAEYCSACHFVATKVRLWLQRSRHGLPPIPSEALLTDGTGLISTNNEVYSLIEVLNKEVLSNETVEYRDEARRYDTLLRTPDIRIALSKWISGVEALSHSLQERESYGSIEMFERITHRPSSRAQSCRRMEVIRTVLMPFFPQQSNTQVNKLHETYVRYGTACTATPLYGLDSGMHSSITPGLALGMTSWDEFKKVITRIEKPFLHEVSTSAPIPTDLKPLPPLQLLTIKKTPKSSTALLTETHVDSADDPGIQA